VFDYDICTRWHLSIYVPLLDEIVDDFDVRFPGENIKCFNLKFLIPSNLTQIINNSNQLNNAIKIISNQYSSLLNSSSFIISTKLEGEFKIIENVLLIPQFQDMNSACESISVATAKRSFSSLRLLKTWLRARMGKERLNGLALKYIHKDIDNDNTINIQNIIDRYYVSNRTIHTDLNILTLHTLASINYEKFHTNTRNHSNPLISNLYF